MMLPMSGVQSFPPTKFDDGLSVTVLDAGKPDASGIGGKGIDRMKTFAVFKDRVVIVGPVQIHILRVAVLIAYDDNSRNGDESTETFA